MMMMIVFIFVHSATIAAASSCGNQLIALYRMIRLDVKTFYRLSDLIRDEPGGWGLQSLSILPLSTTLSFYLDSNRFAIFF